MLVSRAQLHIADRYGLPFDLRQSSRGQRDLTAHQRIGVRVQTLPVERLHLLFGHVTRDA